MSVWREENWILVSMWESCIMELFGYEQVAKRIENIRLTERGFLHGDNSW